MSASSPSTKSSPSQQSNTSISSQSDSESMNLFDPMHIQDPIHGYMVIPDRIKEIIDTPHVQRLRHLKQLGTSYYVFPGASHNRFEHSLGVMYLAHKLLKKISDRQPELNITDDELFIVSAAGLLHDLGHGPFSHVFDNEFVPSVIESTFKHEEMSVKLIKDLFISNQIHIEEDHLELIQALVRPKEYQEVQKKYKAKERGFLFEIVANEHTGIDVDKWDYFLRDSKNVGIGISFTYDRLIEHVRVINDHICWSEKTSFELYEMFRTRYELFKKIYSHKAGKSIELLICDILKHANPIFNVIGAIDDCAQYLKLNDTIIQRIELMEIDETKPGMKELQKAQDLIKRLHSRKLYKCVGYCLFQPADLIKFNPRHDIIDIIDTFSTPEAQKTKSVLNEEKDGDTMSECHEKIAYKDIERQWAKEMYQMYTKHQLSQRENEDKREKLEEGDIVFNLMCLSFGIETQHPMEKVFLYDSKNPKACYQVHCDQIMTMSDKFKEVAVKAYVKKSEWKEECQYIFTQFLKKKGIIDGGCDENVHRSLVLSPHMKKRTKKGKETLRESNAQNRNKRKLSTGTNLMDTTRRNKKARNK